jgi:6-phosphogluconolactonase (cycloisomerase 2 family)
VSVFAVDGSQLSLREIVPSAGEFPVSIAVHNDLAYVLNARAGGSVSGYQVRSGLLQPIPGSTPARTRPSGHPRIHEHTRSGRLLTRRSPTHCDDEGQRQQRRRIRVLDHGLLSDSRVVNNLPGAVPFAFDFDRAGNLVLTEAGPNAVESFTLRHDGAITPIASVATGQAATCWVTHIESHFYASNAGSASLTEVDSTVRGSLSFVANFATGPGTVDASASPDGAFLYVQTGGNGGVDAFRVGHDGSLAPIGTVIVPNPVGGEGIVAV